MKLFQKLFGSKESKASKDRAKQSIANEVTAKPKTALEEAQEKIIAQRMKHYHDKVEKYGKMFMERLNEYLGTYFNNFVEDDDEANEYAYNLLNKEWKAYVQKCNATQKVVKLKADSFEFEVARIVRENKQFQKKEKVVDFTKL